MPLHIRTPCFESSALSRHLGAPVFLKMEALQPSGSFKLRGIGALAEELAAAGARRLVSSSGGNAGLATAYAARKLGLAATVVVPETTAPAVRARIAEEEALVEVSGKVWDEADVRARVLAQAPGAAYIHPFDHPTIWRGHATLIDEVAEDWRGPGTEPGAIVVAVGGGGLLCGVLEGLARVGWGCPLLAVETEGAASYAAALAAGKAVAIERIATLATTLGARKVCDAAAAWARRHPIRSLLVSDRAAIEACLSFADEQRILVEPACGAAIAAVIARPEYLTKAKSVILVVCGGAGVDRARLEAWAAAVGLTSRPS